MKQASSFSWIRLPADVSFHCGCRDARNLCSSALMQVGARIGEGRSLRGRNPERPTPHRGSPAPVPSLGSRHLPQLACRLLPLSQGSSPKTEIVELERAPPQRLLPGTGEGEGGESSLGARLAGGPGAAPAVPPLALSGALPWGASCLPRALRPGLAARQRPLALSPRHPGPGEGWSHKHFVLRACLPSSS